MTYLVAEVLDDRAHVPLVHELDVSARRDEPGVTLLVAELAEQLGHDVTRHGGGLALALDLVLSLLELAHVLLRVLLEQDV